MCGSGPEADRLETGRANVSGCEITGSVNFVW